MTSHHMVSLSTLVAVVVGSGACATKGYVANTVDEHVGRVERRVSRVEQMAEDTAVGSGRNAAHIREVDATANGALETAGAAETTARSAQSTATDAWSTARELEADQRRLLFEVVLADDHGHFGFGAATLPEPASRALDDLVEDLRASPGGIFVEVEGHTDANGSAPFNKRLGLARAESVRQYLHEQHRLPLHKINVISYGEEKPVAPNDTIEGRAKNRRVVVRVLG